MIQVCEVIDVNQTNELHACIQPKSYDGCHDLIQKASSFNYAAVVSVKLNDYRIWNILCMIWGMSKDKTVNIMKNYDLKEKRQATIIFKCVVRKK